MRKQLTFDDATPIPADDDDSALDRALADVGLRRRRKPSVAAPSSRERDVFWLWAEHEPVLQVWGDVQTSWRVGMAGATGLDKHDLQIVIRAHGHRGREADSILRDLLVMERAALDEWSRQRDTDKRTWRD